MSASIDDAGVGQTVAGRIGFTNASFDIDATTLAFSNIDLRPACSDVACDPGDEEVGVYALAPTGTAVGPFCSGVWSINEISPGVFRFAPPGGGAVVLQPGLSCDVTFTATARRVPTTDVAPGEPGVQTAPTLQVTTGFPAVGNPSPATVNKGMPVLAGSASTDPTPAVVPGTTTESVTLDAAPGLGAGVPPTGTMNLLLLGDPCSLLIPVASRQLPVDGFGTYTTDPVPVADAGTYAWQVLYSGDANYESVGIFGCGDPNHTVTFTGPLELATHATPVATFGAGIKDTATLSGGDQPTGTITFDLYGPANPTCVGDPTFTSTVPVDGNGDYESAMFQPVSPSPGLYVWVASYSGDANNAPLSHPCGAPNETSVITGVPGGFSIELAKVAQPLSRPEPGGDFEFLVTITNTTTANAVRITSLIDDVYGDIGTSPPPGSSCGTAVGTLLLSGQTYSCEFSVSFTGGGGDSQTSELRVAAVGFNPQDPTTPHNVAARDDATISITDVAPSITVTNDVDPPSRPEPGSPFTYTATVVNESAESVTITALTDDVYGDLATQGTCTDAIGAVLAPAATYSCTHTQDFRGNANTARTSSTTFTVADDDGSSTSESDSATVELGDALPVVDVTHDVSPATRAVPGGDFTHTVTVTNPGQEPVTITDLGDDSSCAVGELLEPGESTACTFTTSFTGTSPASRTETVTVTAEDDEGNEVSAHDDAVMTLVAASDSDEARPSVVSHNPLVRTGATIGGLVLLGALMTGVGAVLLRLNIRRRVRM